METGEQADQGGFDWDDQKAEDNLRKHGVRFEDAQMVFGDPCALTLHDREHSTTEDRFITIGLALTGELLTVIHAERGDDIRIISARKATRSEKRQYVNRK
ncbi:MAG: BrnT family toxin [Phycisphaerales bacterium]|nr:BrnT family toxin [Phycisphaerales bacterium]